MVITGKNCSPFSGRPGRREEKTDHARCELDGLGKLDCSTRCGGAQQETARLPGIEHCSIEITIAIVRAPQYHEKRFKGTALSAIDW
jgi:hypothetical protein